MANEFKVKKGLIVAGASGGTVVDIQGSQGQLFSVTDDLSGSIFAVSDISGVPILDVNSSGAVNIDGTLIGSSTAYFSGAITTNLSSEGTYFTGGSGAIRQLSITSGTNTSAHALHTFNIASSNGKYEFDINGTTELSLVSSNATFAGDVTATTFLGDLNGTINTATTGVTQTAGNNSTLIATTAYADAAAAAVPIGDYLPLAGGTLTGGLIGTSANFGEGVKSTDGFFNNVEGIRLLYPNGGSNNALGNSGTTGALKITLPQGWTSTMMRMAIKVYEYSESKSFTINCGGYNHSDSSAWINEFAYIESQSEVDRNFTVRFGYDSNNKCCIYIGELTSVWSYPKVFVTDFEAGFNNTVASNWQDGWVISMETTAFENVSQIRTNCQINNWKRNGQDVYYGSGIGNVGIGLTNPVDRLDLYDSDDNVGMYFHTATSGTGGGNGLRVGQNNANAFVWNYEATPLSLATSGTARLTINATGGIRFNTGYGAGTLVTDASGNITVSSGGGAGGPYLPLSAGSSYPLTDTLFGTNINMSGDGTYAGSMNLGNGGGTGEKHLTIGNGSTGNGYRYIDLVGDTTYTDYGLRIIRGNSGANTSSQIVHRGTGDFSLQTTEAGKMRFVTANSERMRIDSTGNVGIGTTSPAKTLHVFSGTDNEGIFMQGTGGGHWFNFQSGTSNLWSMGAQTGMMGWYNRTTGNVGYKMVIQDGGNVGIGTTSPRNKLDIALTGAEMVYPIATGTSPTGGFRIGHTDASWAGVELNMGIANASAQGYPAWIQAQNPADLSVSRNLLLNPNGGNVGIGTTSPGAKLDVINEARISYSPSNQYRVRITNSDGNGRILVDGDTSSLIFGTSGTGTNATATERMRIDSSGNVGIGTTAPAVKLHVGTATLGAAPDTNADVISSGGITIDHNKRLSFDTGYYVHGNIRYNGTGTGVSEAKLEYQGYYGHNFITRSNSKMVIEGDTGNVGIGTTTPSAKLDVLGGSGNDIIAKFKTTGTGTGDYSEIHIANNNDDKLVIGSIGSNYTNSSWAGMRYVYATAGDLGLKATASNGNVRIYAGSGSLERMRITSTGNVGIGTTSPVAKLDVRGNAAFIGGNETTTNLYVHATNTAGAPARTACIDMKGYEGRAIGTFFKDVSYSSGVVQEWFAGINYAGNFARYSIGFDATDGTPTPEYLADAKFTVTNLGNVGIGTYDPNSRLEVIGDGGTVLDIQGTQGQLFSVTDDLSGDIFSVADISGVPIMNVNSDGTSYFDGNVGIGTTSPGAKLEVNGNVAINSTGLTEGFQWFNDTNEIFSLEDTAGAGELLLLSSNSVKVKLNANGSSYLNGGNVGIGTTSPGDVLVVKGGSPGNIDLVSFQNNAGNETHRFYADSANDGVISTVTNAGVIANLIQSSGDSYFNGGNVGIGTTSPGDKLHVNGTVRSQAPATSDWALLGYNSAGSAASGLWFDNGSGDILLRRSDNSLQTRIRSAGSSYINGGSLGLGTTSPAQKLTVNSGRMLVSNTTTPIYIKAGSTYKSWVHHIGGSDGYIFAPSTADNGETWDWANQTKLGANGVVTAKNFQLSSDERFKNNIKDIKDIKVEAAFKSFEMESSPGEKRYGVVAQELEKTNPELVETDHEGFKSVKYIDLLIAKIAELEARLEKLEK